MEDLIRQAFLHVDIIGPHVAEGHYDLVGPNGEIILPQVWETMVEPEWTITMHMWPMPEPPPKDEIKVVEVPPPPPPPSKKQKGKSSSAIPPPPPPPPPPAHGSAPTPGGASTSKTGAHPPSSPSPTLNSIVIGGFTSTVADRNLVGKKMASKGQTFSLFGGSRPKPKVATKGLVAKKS